MGSRLGVRAYTPQATVINPVTIFWICWTCIWTALVVAGMSYLIARRNTPLLRIRGLVLSLSAITLLHLYWMSVQLGLILGPMAPAVAEFWIMGIYFPFGIALFHASNSRFLHVAQAQKKYARHGVAKKPSGPRRRGGILGLFRRLDYTSKILCVVGLGMLFQLFITILMYVVSRKFHRSWGIPGTEVNGTEMEQKMEAGRGWEWWPSVFWQFFWAWLVAPYILWKARGIHDTQGWRFQTIACAIANLHATPMWVIALYVPAMAPVNQYWVPPQWIAISIMLMEIFTVFLPCWEVMRSQALRQETLESIAHWEAKNKSGHGAKSLHSATTAVESMMSGWKSTNGTVRSSDSGESILTMSALEHVLDRNPGPLQEFSALRDFSGENIAFLTSVAEWKSSLPPAARSSSRASTDHETRELVHERYNRALRISPTTRGGSEKDMMVSSEDGGAIGDRAQFWGEVPEAFDETVFDDAEMSIKYLVLTNTWPKFVKDRRSSMDTFDTEAANDARL